MANNTPEGPMISQSQGPTLDPDSPEDQDMMKQMDTQQAWASILRGEEQSPTEVGTGLDPMFGAGRAAYDAQIEEQKLQELGNAKGVVEPGSEEDRKLNNRIKVQQKSAEFAKANATAENQPFELDPAERAATDLGAINGAVWRGQARYSSGDPPALIATPDGRMYYKVGHYVIPMQNKNEAAFFVGLDQKMFRDQQLKRKLKIEEMELAESLDALEEEASVFEGINRAALGRRLDAYSADKTPEELEILGQLYDDTDLIQRIMQMDPSSASGVLDQLEAVMFGGGSMSDARGVINNAGRAQMNRQNSVLGSVANGYSSQLERHTIAMEKAQAEIDDLSLKIAEEKHLIKIDSETGSSEGNPEKLAVLKEMRKRAQTTYTNSQSDHRRVESQYEILRARVGASWSPEWGGGRNLDQMFDKPSRKHSLTRPGAPVWCIMDSVARINGFNGVSDGNLRTMLSDPERAAEFIRECQGYAQTVGWETSEDKTMPWVESIIEHIVTAEDPERVKAVVQAAMAEVAPGADMPSAPPESDPDVAGTDVKPVDIEGIRNTIGDPPETGSEASVSYAANLRDILTKSGMTPEEAQDISDKVLITGNLDSLKLGINDPTASPLPPMTNYVPPSERAKGPGFIGGP